MSSLVFVLALVIIPVASWLVIRAHARWSKPSSASPPGDPTAASDQKVDLPPGAVLFDPPIELPAAKTVRLDVTYPGGGKTVYHSVSLMKLWDVFGPPNGFVCEVCGEEWTNDRERGIIICHVCKCPECKRPVGRGNLWDEKAGKCRICTGEVAIVGELTDGGSEGGG